jgi:hypothetical protein
MSFSCRILLIFDASSTKKIDHSLKSYSNEKSTAIYIIAEKDRKMKKFDSLIFADLNESS